MDTARCRLDSRFPQAHDRRRAQTHRSIRGAPVLLAGGRGRRIGWYESVHSPCGPLPTMRLRGELRAVPTNLERRGAAGGIDSAVAPAGLLLPGRRRRAHTTLEPPLCCASNGVSCPTSAPEARESELPRELQPRRAGRLTPRRFGHRRLRPLLCRGTC